MSDNAFHQIYGLLYDHFGTQGWWPADTPFEVIVGAVLTQNTNWSNVEKAINNLKEADLLTYHRLSSLHVDEIASHIRPSGYYNLKARRLKNLLGMINCCYGGELEEMLTDEMSTARENLLSVKGVGPETADSILLYACGHPIFVVDMYTHRVFSRHLMIDEETSYQAIQDTFMDHLDNDPQLFNEYHALIVRVAATYCRKSNPLCDQCPLNGFNL